MCDDDDWDTPTSSAPAFSEQRGGVISEGVASSLQVVALFQLSETTAPRSIHGGTTVTITATQTGESEMMVVTSGVIPGVAVDFLGENNDDSGGGRGGGRDGDRGDGGGEEKKREFYIPPEVENVEDLFTSGITTGVNFMKLDEIEVKVTGNDAPPPITSFETSGLRPHLLENVKKSGYTKPTAIQKYAIPVILSGRDLMSCAQTGSGKTAAFMLPIIHNLLSDKNPPNTENNCAQPVVVIMSPTRELAIQIADQGKKFAYNSTVKVAVIYGGTSTNHQRGRILGGCHILVATPGRLKDFVNRGNVSFNSLKYFVLDEADRMLDMGFLGDVEEMLSHQSMPATGERQTLMFSATFPEEVQQLAGKFLLNYIFIAVGIVGSACTDVEQKFFQVSKFDKRSKLVSILEKAPNERTLIFVETKRNADFLATFLSEQNIQSTSIHGDRYQSEREKALLDFKTGHRKVLVATGVAARGLDIKDVQHVINYDLPKSIDEYVHRIGRTGRVGNKGKATSFFDEDQDRNLASDLAKILSQAKQEIPEWLGSKSYGGSADQFGGRDIRGDDFGRGQDFSNAAAVQEEEVW
uniref:RNA helicase n=1 Tax=Tribolium castaneum TaxID=7070 RepID=Q5EFR8_TRICA|nr:vasa RNA helicase [Tribolium castaneum]